MYKTIKNKTIVNTFDHNDFAYLVRSVIYTNSQTSGNKNSSGVCLNFSSIKKYEEFLILVSDIMKNYKNTKTSQQQTTHNK